MAKKHNRKPARKPSPAQTLALKAANHPAMPQTARRGFPAKTAALALCMVAAVALGVWFALSPSLERDRMAERQAELLENIEQGGGEITLDETFTADEVDFYDNDGGSPEADVLPFIGEPLAAESPVPAGATAEAGAPHDTTAPLDTVITGIGVLTIDKIGAKLPVSEGVTSAQLKVGPGHVPQTPEIGATGNAVVAGHRSYTYGEHFNRLGEMAVGDPIRYQSIDGKVMEFEVSEILEVQPGDPAALWQPMDESILTLYTCTPVRTASHRLLVRARLLSQEEGTI